MLFCIYKNEGSKRKMNIMELFSGEAKRPYIIAEISQNHDGSLGQAHAFIDAVADNGVDAVKFQTHYAKEESTKYEPFRIPFSYEDKTRYDYWKRMEFSNDQWYGLFKHAQERKIELLSSPFSMKALRLLHRIGVPAWKFGSGEVFNDELLDAAIRTDKPILLSTGLSTFSEIREQLERVRNNGNPVVLFQCVTAYPAKSEMIDIQLIPRFKKQFCCNVGISDHSATIYPALAAMTLGAVAVEVHVTMSRYMFGPDVKASVTLEQLREIVGGAQFIASMLQAKVDLSKRNSERTRLKCMFSRGLFATENIAANTTIERHMIQAKKPNIGIEAVEMSKVLGRVAKRDIKQDEPIQYEDLK